MIVKLKSSNETQKQVNEKKNQKKVGGIKVGGFLMDEWSVLKISFLQTETH